MAIIHSATLTPSKQEVVAGWLDLQEWGGAGPVELLASYRYDDPAGEVGVEGHIARRGDLVLHVPLTYRGAAAPALEQHLVTTMEHSALGTRWVYDATGDPAARACYERALAGEKEQAVMEVWDGERCLGVREPTARVELRGGGSPGSVAFVHVLGEESVTASSGLVASWEGGSGVIAFPRSAR